MPSLSLPSLSHTRSNSPLHPTPLKQPATPHTTQTASCTPHHSNSQLIHPRAVSTVSTASRQQAAANAPLSLPFKEQSFVRDLSFCFLFSSSLSLFLFCFPTRNAGWSCSGGPLAYGVRGQARLTRSTECIGTSLATTNVMGWWRRRDVGGWWWIWWGGGWCQRVCR